jgi:hypothetical protein
MFASRSGFFSGAESLWVQYDASARRLTWKSLRNERNKPVVVRICGRIILHTVTDLC